MMILYVISCRSTLDHLCSLIDAPLSRSADDELVDDEALLTEEDKARPAAPAGEPATAC